MTTESFLLRFPQELVDTIIRANDGDSSTLCSCALVCRAFQPPSQAGLFSAVRINPGKRTRAQQLFDLLVDSPHLRHQVRTIEITDIDNGNWGTDFLAGVIALCGLLDSVTSFGVEFYALHPSPELRAAICGLCQRAPLVSLRLAGLGEVNLSELSALLASPALEELSLWDIGFPTLNEQQLSALNKRLPLARCSLRLWNATPSIVARWLVDGDSLSSLRYLCVACHPGGPPYPLDTASHFQRIIDASWGLEGLNLRLERSGSIFREFVEIQRLTCHFLYTVPRVNPIHLSLSKLTNLRVLSISFVVYRDWPTSCAQLLASLLESCSKILVTLNIAIASLDEGRPVVNWAPLDSALSSAHFPTLSTVRFTVTSRFPPDNIPGFIKDIRCGLPDLDARGILRF
ncbi:hypothetical protein DFH06DRAFT_1474699 [Mycena polygramma]|nr:hypothetical protein DFH06DRAFT_1474699 [Mycena polygramma]